MVRAPAITCLRALITATLALGRAQSVAILFSIVFLAGTNPTAGQYRYCERENLEQIIEFHVEELLKLNEEFESYWYPPNLPPDIDVPDIGEADLRA